MKFSKALENVIEHSVNMARKGWNGKGMFIYLFGNKIFTANDIETKLIDLKVPLNREHKENYEVSNFIVLKTADNKIIPWQPSQADMLADDWERVNL